VARAPLMDGYMDAWMDHRIGIRLILGTFILRVRSRSDGWSVFLGEWVERVCKISPQIPYFHKLNIYTIQPDVLVVKSGCDWKSPTIW
jgi:hypothetical protein